MTTKTFSIIKNANASQEIKPALDSQQEGLSFANFVPIFLVFAIFYFLIIRPQIRKNKEQQKMISEIKIGTEVIEDIAINKGSLPEKNKVSFKLAGGELSRLFEQIGKCLNSYLEKNPKIIRIVDEMNLNLDIKNYGSYAKSLLSFSLGEEWHMQEGSNKKIYLWNR